MISPWTLILMQWDMSELDKFTDLVSKQINRIQDRSFDTGMFD